MPALAAMKMSTAGKVARRVEEDNIRAAYVEDAKAYQMTSVRTSWFEANEKRQVERRHRLLEMTNKEELVQANKQLVLERRARLREFLTEEAVSFELQLNDMGLAFMKERA